LEETGVVDVVDTCRTAGGADKSAALAAAGLFPAAAGTEDWTVEFVWFSFETVSSRAIKSSFLPVTAKECLDNSDDYGYSITYQPLTLRPWASSGWLLCNHPFLQKTRNEKRENEKFLCNKFPQL
jgi:hypothetical protein